MMSVEEDIFRRGFAAVYWMGVLTLLLECESVHDFFMQAEVLVHSVVKVSKAFVM